MICPGRSETGEWRRAARTVSEESVRFAKICAVLVEVEAGSIVRRKGYIYLPDSLGNGVQKVSERIGFSAAAEGRIVRRGHACGRRPNSQVESSECLCGPRVWR